MKRVLTISDRWVEFEWGEKVFVPKFEVYADAVSVSEFSAFCIQARYNTFNERNGDSDTYFRNPRLEGVCNSELDKIPAYFITPTDAVAYCNFTGRKMLTEAQWMAASIIHPLANVSESMKIDALKNSRSQFISGQHEEFVVGKEGILLRKGPYWFLDKDWRESLSKNRVYISSNHADIFATFRTMV